VSAGFGRSLFERLVDRYGNTVTRTLTIQYRMHTDIMTLSSREFYGEQLVADPTVAEHRLCDLPNVVSLPLSELPIEFFDTAGASYDEEPEPDSQSRSNPLEAEFVARKVQALIDAGLSVSEIGVIAPYNAQVRLLRTLLPLAGLEIDTVDGFQGREKEAVLVSLVRSNTDGEIGFLSEVRRTNVALTRARRKLLVVGDSATLAAHPFYERWIEYIGTLDAHRSVWEEIV
jgi:superfamily I DNA and/or RNA helicase